MKNLESVGWKKAMGDEMPSLHKNQTWELVQLQKGKKTIGLQVGIHQEGAFCRKGSHENQG